MLSLFRDFRASQDTIARDRLICAHLHLVHGVARRFSGLGESLDDLIQEGTIGLLNAVDLYDPDRGIKFSTYACHLISGQMQHYLRDRGRLIRQPAWVQELSTKVMRASEQLSQDLGRDPSPAEIAAKLDMPEDSVKNVLNARELSHVVSLSAPTDNSVDIDPVEVDHGVKASSGKGPFRLPIEDRILLDEAIASLKPLEQQVVRLFFFQDLTQSEVARKLTISVNYASYLLRRATARIKSFLEEQQRQETESQLEQEPDFIPPALDAPIYDTVTRAYSGAYLRARVSEEIARGRRYPTNFALMLVRVSGLDYTNEQMLLCAASQFFKNSSRTVDLIAYLGNHCFALLLPHTGREAKILGERICQHVATQHAMTVPMPEKVSLNVGFSVFPLDGVTTDHLFQRAELALETAKASGPNAAVSAGSLRQLHK